MDQLTSITLTHDVMPLVAIAFMNDTHREEISLVQQLGETLTSYQQADIPAESAKEAITQTLENWLEHTKNHFAAENELMQTYDFPAFPVHAKEHESALAQLSEQIEQWQKTSDVAPLMEFVFKVWPAWFTQHVNTMDAMTAQFAVINGYRDRSSDD